MSGVGGYDAVVDTAVSIDLAGTFVRALSLENLIASKRAAGRAKDLAVIPVLEETLRMSREPR